MNGCFRASAWNKADQSEWPMLAETRHVRLSTGDHVRLWASSPPGLIGGFRRLNLARILIAKVRPPPRTPSCFMAPLRYRILVLGPVSLSYRTT